MARRRKARGRAVDGVLLLNKPKGITSNAALQKAKRLYDAAKAGHTGSLDPLATGVLPLCFGEATKFSQYLLDSDKRYVVRAKLGVITDTGDADGKVLTTSPVPELNTDKLLAVVKQFEGDIEQVPPMYSALKHQGQPLYKLAREGKEVERKPRKVTLYGIELLDLDGDEFELDVRCSKGTYIRSLIEDIGQELGCGGHVIALHRTEAGPFLIGQTFALDDLGQISEQNELDERLLPPWSAVSDWPAVNLTENAAYYIQQGQPVMAPEAPTEGWVRLSEGEDKFLGVGEILDDGRIAPRRLVSQDQS